MGKEARLFFASAEEGRPHEEQPEYACPAKLQNFINTYNPTVIKIDAEGAEVCLMSVDDFKATRLVIGEYDFRHNPSQKMWQQFKRHLERHNFRVKMNNLPQFSNGMADFTGQGKAQGNSGRNFR